MSTTIAQAKGVRTGWGFSSFIEIENSPPLLFDMGADGATLLYNMKQLGIDPRGIGIIVISHAHDDHAGGLSDILEINKGAVSFRLLLSKHKLCTVL